MIVCLYVFCGVQQLSVGFQSERRTIIIIMSFRIEDILKPNEEEVPPEVKFETQMQTLSNRNNHHYHQTSINNYWQSINYAKMYQQFYENNPYFPYADCLDSAQQYETFLANYSSGRYWPMHAISSNANVLPFAYQTYSKRKSSQVRFTAVQISALEKRFSSNKYLSPEERRILSSDLKLSDRQVKTWFQNRRAKWRRSNCPSSSNEKIQDSDSDLEELLVCDEKK